MPKAEWICKQCYEIDRPITSQRGSWLQYFIVFILVGLLILIPTLMWLAFLFLLGVISKGKIFNSSLPVFPLAHHLPQTPETVKICRHCGAISQMVTLTSREGIDAYEWHQKKKTIQQGRKDI